MRLADVEIEARDGLVLARIVGEIDMSNADGLGALLAANVGNEALGLVVDLSETQYIDSAGIRVLYELRQRLKDRRQRLALVVPPGSATERTLRLVNADHALGIVESADAATATITEQD
jgi:anti-anti-sigma factor